MLKKHILLLGCALAILLGISSVLLRNWRQKTIRCQGPLLTTVPSFMPKTISGISARLEWTRYWNRDMPPWWERNSGFPQPGQNYTYSVEEIFVQGNDIWTIYDFLPEIQNYNIVTGERVTYDSIDGEKIEWVRHLLITKDEEVWITAKLERSYALARFDRVANAFKVIEGNNPFSNWKGSRPPEWGSNLAETVGGNLLIPFEKNIYRYDPQQNITQSLLPDDFGFSIQSLAVFGDSLWFMVEETKAVWALDLSTQKLIGYGPAPKEFKGQIAVDNMGRVWLGYLARLEKNANGEYQWWYPKTYPAEFITLVSPYEDSLSGNGELEYRWSDISKVFVASDDSIWFLAGSGIVKYDAHQDSWCLSAPAETISIAEDKDGNLWMAPKMPTSQGLYKYKLNP